MAAFEIDVRRKALFANRTHMLPVAMLPTLLGARADVVILSRKWYAFFPERPTHLVKILSASDLLPI